MYHSNCEKLCLFVANFYYVPKTVKAFFTARQENWVFLVPIAFFLNLPKLFLQILLPQINRYKDKYICVLISITGSSVNQSDCGLLGLELCRLGTSLGISQH